MLRSLPPLATLVTLAAVILMTGLGVWQLERAEQKRQRSALLAERQQQKSLTLTEVIGQSGDIRDFPVQVTGKLDSQRLLLWDNRILSGRVGYEVLAVLETNEGNLLVNFGWLQAPPYRDLLPQTDLPWGMVTLEGVVVVPQLNPMVRETNEAGWPRRVQQPDLDYLQTALDTRLLPFMLQVADTQPFGLENNWKPVVMPAEKHLGYAVQWFGLALACLGVFILAVRRKWRTSL
ncbi:SURF1 family protein [Bowmanella dokdonensis]|uniref:SURF1-like protein n=1 Tax=Bowmanella dokdonensis TaxID=751969 RepID=A0A939DJE3_9ALTE|nr:SURF1 family protein [Bowmanella dokdonensis]MBN7823614.1 SURF1 family protein [Bowmanella dokdonensis]